jgi:hypothetical protein
MQCYVVCQKFTYFSQEQTASIFMVKKQSAQESSMYRKYGIDIGQDGPF